MIDDLPENRALLRRALESEGWTVVEAENGREGLDVSSKRTLRSSCSI